MALSVNARSDDLSGIFDRQPAGKNDAPSLAIKAVCCDIVAFA